MSFDNSEIKRDDINQSGQLAGVWCGAAFAVLFCLAFLPLAQFIPPPSPELNGEQLLARYSDNVHWVITGMVLTLFAMILYVPWSATMAIQMARLEGRVPFWAIVSFGCGLLNVVAFVIPCLLWTAAYYRLDRAPEMVLVLSDIGWISFLIFYQPILLQQLAVAIVGLRYKGDNKILPRWFCYFSLWVCFLFLPAGLVAYVHSGVFAWNGLISFWTPLSVFLVYYLVALPVFYKAVKNHASMASVGLA